MAVGTLCAALGTADGAGQGLQPPPAPSPPGQPAAFAPLHLFSQDMRLKRSPGAHSTTSVTSVV